jgi:hypothetical protein
MPTSSAPGTVLIAGRSAFTISRSGFALSSLRQKAASSNTPPITVYPLTDRNDAVCTSRVTLFVKSMASVVLRSIRRASIGEPSRSAAT